MASKFTQAPSETIDPDQPIDLTTTRQSAVESPRRWWLTPAAESATTHGHAGGDTSAHAADDPGAHAHHVVPLWLMFAVFGALMVLTVLTVAVTVVDFGYVGNVIVAVAVAAVKAALVALFFMHLRWDNPFNGIAFGASLVFIALFIVIALLDADETRVNVQPATLQRQLDQQALQIR